MGMLVRSVVRGACALLSAAAGLSAAGAAEAACNMSKVLDLPVTLTGTRPTVPVKINGTPVQLVVETSSFRSQLEPNAARQMNLPREAAPEVTLRGVGCNACPDQPKVKALGLGDQTVPNWRFLLTPMPGTATGVLGEDFLGAFDEEFDFSHGAVRLFKPQGCANSPLAYWAGDRPVSVVPLEWPKNRDDKVTQLIGEAYLNGTRVRVVFSSASSRTLVDERAAVHAGVKLDGPDVTSAGVIYGIGHKPLKVSVARFASFKLGGEEVKNSQFRIGQLNPGVDMIVGADFFLSHRVYVANSQHRLYITYEGGPVFGAPVEAVDEEAKPTAPGEAADAGTPTDAEGFTRRATTLAAKQDMAGAVADVSRAIELAPGEPRYWLQRANLRRTARQPALAMEDLDKALDLKPGLLEGLIMRAQLRLAARDSAGAASDVAAAFPPAAARGRRTPDVRRHRPQRRPVRLGGGAVRRLDLRPRGLLAPCGRPVRPLPGAGHDGPGTGQGPGRLRALAEPGARRGRRARDPRHRSLQIGRIRRGDPRLRRGPRPPRPSSPWRCSPRGAAKLKKGLSQEGKADQEAAAALQPNVVVQAKRLGLGRSPRTGALASARRFFGRRRAKSSVVRERLAKVVEPAYLRSMPPCLRPTRLEYVVDGERLRAQLSAAALDAIGDEAEQRRRALEILKAALFRGRMIAKERLEAGAGGIETATLLSGVTDEVIKALYAFTTVHMFRARNPTEGERMALMAVGGYGRGALAPFSDIDLLFLRPYKPTAHSESVIEFMLYALWDLGFKVGHASRTIDECIKLSREDFTIRTSILEARRLCGDEKLAEELKRRFRDEVVKGTATEFVAAKLRERDERHAEAGASRYVVEPNVKEGKGALRGTCTPCSGSPSTPIRANRRTGS